MSGGYHYYDHSGSSQELIGPRHRLPIIAAPRPPITSSIPSTNAQASQPPWMIKHDSTSNYHQNSGFYGQSAVARDYASISRAHCNDESSAWSNPNFSNPLGNPPFGGVLALKNVSTKNDVQNESMDLSSSHGGKTVASPPKMVAINGDVAQDLKSHAAPANCKSPIACTNASVTNVTTNQKFGPTTNDVTRAKPISLVPDNVEFALESLFHSETSVIVPTPKDMCVESVEKLLKSPEGSDDDLNVLYDSHISEKVPNNSASDTKSTEKPSVGQAATEVIVKNCDCNVKTGSTSAVSDLMSAKSINCERLNDVIEKNCDARDTDQILPEQASTVTNDTSLGNASSCKPANFAAKPEPCVGNEEITYVQVENELEKMFAGIEDSSDPLMPANSSATCIDAQNSSLNLSATQVSRSSTNLFDSVHVPAKTRKKKTSKKSKPAGASKSAKDKQKSSSSFKESSSTSQRVPVIHIEGSKENPISAHIINSIKSEEDDVSDGRTSAKRKLGKSDRAVKKSTSNFAFKNYDPATSDATWVCIFCNLCAHAPGMAGEATGDLFGPYFIRTPEQINLDESKIHSWRTTHLEQVKKKQKRSLSIESGYMDLSSDEQKSFEVWAHENCIVWASGVHLIGSKLIGLEEAVMQALETICAHCSNKGASIGCRARHCSSCAHYSCAIYTGWKLDTDTFISTCSVHSVPLNV